MRPTYCALAALPLVALIASPALAADAQPTATPGATTDAPPAEIIVTAQKRAEPLQKVPVAITVVSGDAMTRLSTNNIEDTQRLVPALTFVKGDTSLNSALFLRGLGTVSFSIAAEPSVTSVLDGVVLARAGESFGDLYDLDRVEVLRGPQGTLFGKNASAGVINIVTKEPGKELGGYMDVGVFEGGEYKLKANLSGPIGDNWRAGVTGFYSDYKGNIWDETTHSKINGYQHYGVRGQLIGDVTPNLHVKLIADYRKADDQCCAFVIGALNPTPSASQAALQSILPPALGGDTRQSIQSMPNRTEEETYGASLQADLALGTHTLTSITAWRKWNNEEVRDGDWVDQLYLGNPLIHDIGPERSHTFTQELRLTSPTGGFVDYVVGAFYYQAVAERTYTRNDTYCLATTAARQANGLIPCPADLSTIVNAVGVGVFGSTFDNVAAYGQATWHFAPTFRLVTGLRYTHDKVTAYDTRTDALNGVSGPAGIAGNFDANVAAGGTFNGTPWTGETSANNVSGKAALEYDLAPHHMFYASYSRGYKGPAFNVFFNMTAANTAPISAETSNAFEAGLKNSFANGRLIFNIDGFYTKVYNYQANYPTTVNGTVTTTIINAGNVSTRGGELELLFRPNRHLTINGGYSYTDARVDQFLEPPAAQAINYIASGTPLAFAPKNKGNLGATYTQEPTGLPFALEFNALAAYTDKQVSTLAPTNTAAQELAFQEQILKAYTQVDISLAAVDLAKHYRLAVVVKNLFNDHYASTIGTGGPGGSYLYQIPRDSDRYWGVTLHYNF
ncbi:TonB-dependent receptor [Novosphingobium sp. FSW06-99]|uniref:TonB-dependent receptor n=1 Tax=Novosphingobium sp. FSW06-99 TaxID=1739113 RepID=UPI0009EA81F4|nr:TonB-dependent receptor [Novosphingobium sp. FSW06-99]